MVNCCNLSEKISSNDLNNLHETILSKGGLGGKLCGAGGGGFFFEIVPSYKQENIINMYGEKKKVLKVKHEPIGSRLLKNLLILKIINYQLLVKLKLVLIYFIIVGKHDGK